MCIVFPDPDRVRVQIGPGAKSVGEEGGECIECIWRICPLGYTVDAYSLICCEYLTHNIQSKIYKSAFHANSLLQQFIDGNGINWLQLNGKCLQFVTSLIIDDTKSIRVVAICDSFLRRSLSLSLSLDHQLSTPLWALASYSWQWG